MNNVVFVLAVGTGLATLLRWGFRVLPQEGWQILATLPVRKDHSGRWVGVNLTYYGLLTASGGLLAILAFLLLMGSIGRPARPRAHRGGDCPALLPAGDATDRSCRRAQTAYIKRHRRRVHRHAHRTAGSDSDQPLQRRVPHPDGAGDRRR